MKTDQTKRTFIAIKIIPEESLTRFIKEAKKTLTGGQIKWVEDFNLHLTLRFLGETTFELAKSVVNILNLIISEFKPFSFSLTGAGFFGNRNQPRVMFVKIKDTEELRTLADTVNKSLIGLGFANDPKSFSPHLTIGRIKSVDNIISFHQFIETYKNDEFQQVRLNEIIYYESILHTTGPVYKPLKTFKSGSL